MKQSAFSISSSWHTLRWMLLTNKRQLSVLAIGMAVGMFVVGEYVAGGNHVTVTGMSHATPMDFALQLIFGLTYALWMLYGASQAFAYMKTKQSAIAYMMHPSSGAEMFAARLAYVSVVWAVVGGVGLLAGDFARWLLDTLLGGAAPMAIANMWHTVCDVADGVSLTGERWLVAKMSAVSMLYSLWIYTLYVLGSAVFRRHRILFTTIAVTVIHISAAEHISAAADMSAMGICVLLAVLCAVNVAASYAVFSRMQLINNKWFNI